MNGIYNLGLEKFLSSLGMRGFVGVWQPLTCGNRPVSNRNLLPSSEKKVSSETNNSKDSAKLLDQQCGN